MNLFDDLSSLSEWTKYSDESEDSSTYSSPQLPPSAGPSSLGSPAAPKKRGNSVGARILALTMSEDASQAKKPPDFKAIRVED
jgi:hypothetical protein